MDAFLRTHAMTGVAQRIRRMTWMHLYVIHMCMAMPSMDAECCSPLHEEGNQHGVLVPIFMRPLNETVIVAMPQNVHAVTKRSTPNSRLSSSERFVTFTAASSTFFPHVAKGENSLSLRKRKKRHKMAFLFFSTILYHLWRIT